MGAGHYTQTSTAKAFAAFSATAPLAPFTIPRRSLRPQDVQIEILYCGVCHSDLHQVRNEWKEVMPTVYPLVPGHEIVGRVVKVGSAVRKLKEGDIAAVGCMVDSCRVCENCRAGLENYCETGFTLTYNSEDKILGGVTYGGYSESIVTDQAFVLRAKWIGSGRNGTAVVCGHYHLLANAALESGQRAEGRNRWTGRLGTHGREIRACAGRARGAVHHLAK